MTRRPDLLCIDRRRAPGAAELDFVPADEVARVAAHVVLRARALILIVRVVRHARDRKSTRLNSSHLVISYAVFCLKKKKNIISLISLHNVICPELCCRIWPEIPHDLGVRYLHRHLIAIQANWLCFRLPLAASLLT